MCACVCAFVCVSKERRQAGRAAWPRRAFGSRVQSSFPCSRSLRTPCHIVIEQRLQTRILRLPNQRHTPNQTPK